MEEEERKGLLMRIFGKDLQLFCTFLLHIFQVCDIIKKIPTIGCVELLQSVRDKIMNTMKNRIMAIWLCFLILVGALAFTSCDLSGSGKIDPSASDSFVCEKKDWSLIKEGVCAGKKDGKMISANALSKATDALVVGKTYYFVTVLNLELEALTLNGSNDSVVSFNSFTLYNSQGINHNTVSYRSPECGGGLNGEGNGDSLYITTGSSDSVFGYVATEFTPLTSGTLSCSNNTFQMLADDRCESNITVSVFEDKTALAGASSVSVSDLECAFSEDAEKEYFTVTFDMSVEALSGEDDFVVCVIYMRYGVWEIGPWSGATVESANTGKIWDIESEYGRMMAFSYNANSVGKKKIEITLGFEYQDVPIDQMDIEVFMFSENAKFTGDLYEIFEPTWDGETDGLDWMN